MRAEARSALWRGAAIAMAMGLALHAAPAGSGDAWTWALPDGIPAPVVPPDNPMSAARVELGRHLFHDGRLSADGRMSCATCHQQDRAFTDGQAVSAGVTGERGVRSAMSLANVAYLPSLTWANPQLTTLEIQALVPLFGEHPVEMGMAGREAELFERLRSEPRYVTLFRQAFPAEAAQGERALYSLATLTRALAAFQRTLLSFDSPYDRHQRGERDALSPAARRGEALFFGERFECYHCHGGFNFTDNVIHRRLKEPERGFHNTGLYNADGKGAYPPPNPGLVELTGSASDQGRFRTPTLRNVAVTAPYMHDGSVPTLEAVVREHYAAGGLSVTRGQGANPLRSELLTGFEVSDDEVRDLIAFLHALTDERFLRNPAHANPWAPAGARSPTRTTP